MFLFVKSKWNMIVRVTVGLCSPECDWLTVNDVSTTCATVNNRPIQEYNYPDDHIPLTYESHYLHLLNMTRSEQSKLVLLTFDLGLSPTDSR